MDMVYIWLLIHGITIVYQGSDARKQGDGIGKALVRNIKFSVAPKELVDELTFVRNAGEQFRVPPLSQSKLQLLKENYTKQAENLSGESKTGKDLTGDKGVLSKSYQDWDINFRSQVLQNYKEKERNAHIGASKDSKPTIGSRKVNAAKTGVQGEEIKLLSEGDSDGINPLAKIVGGTFSVPYGWPWLASIQYLGEDLYWHHFCGGNLVDSLWIVTAAHCVTQLENCTIRIVLGDYQLTYPSHHEQTINPANIWVHDYYDEDSYTFDIAMIKLAKNAEINSYVQTIDVVTPKADSFNAHDRCYISGWGYNTETFEDVLQESKMTVLSKSECRNHGTTVLDSQICIYSSVASACSGDSGGPLVCLVGHDWKLAGISSYIGSATCAPSYPNVYTRASVFGSWISAVMYAYRK